MSFLRSRQVLSGTARRAVLVQHPRLTHRHYIHLVALPGESALDKWISETLDTTRTYNDDMSRSKLADLFCTLPTRTADSVPGLLPPLHSLVFFHPRTPEAELGTDQTDRDLCPPAPFTRRMWAGGAFRFPSPSPQGLRVGKVAMARVRISKIEKKGFEKGTPMVFVHQNIEYADEEARVSEERIHVYLPSDQRARTRAVREVTDLPEPQYTYTWTPTPTTLFRFSALTWNSHLIHLDPEYARNEEGYPERLVHGPLTALMLIEALFQAGYSSLKRIDNFVYRARNPTLVGRRQHIHGALNPGRNSATLWTRDDDGVVGMTGTVDFLDPVSSRGLHIRDYDEGNI